LGIWWLVGLRLLLLLSVALLVRRLRIVPFSCNVSIATGYSLQGRRWHVLYRPIAGYLLSGMLLRRGEALRDPFLFQQCTGLGQKIYLIVVTLEDILCLQSGGVPFSYQFHKGNEYVLRGQPRERKKGVLRNGVCHIHVQPSETGARRQQYTHIHACQKIIALFGRGGNDTPTSSKFPHTGVTSKHIASKCPHLIGFSAAASAISTPPMVHGRYICPDARSVALK
jgi:hypothetical protein